MTPDPWAGLVLAISPDRAVVGPEAAAVVLLLISNAERVARLDGGGTLSPQLRHMREVLQPVATRSRGHADVRDTLPLPALATEEIEVGEAAGMLGRSTRQTRRLAASGSLGTARRTSRAWYVSRAEVAAYALHTRKETA